VKSAELITQASYTLNCCGTELHLDIAIVFIALTGRVFFWISEIGNRSYSPKSTGHHGVNPRRKSDTKCAPGPTLGISVQQFWHLLGALFGPYVKRAAFACKDAS
jgi:hypothetical protein